MCKEITIVDSEYGFTISDLIHYLKEAKKEYGDIKVSVNDSYGCPCHSRMIQFHDGNETLYHSIESDNHLLIL